MLDDLGNDGRIEEEIDSLFEAAKREKYVHSRSEETFDAIAGLWFLGDAFQSILARISCNYIVSSFLLNSLALIYQRIRLDYNLPGFDASTLTNDEAFQRFLEEIEALKADRAFVQWLKDSLLSKCEKLLDHIEGTNLGNVAKLGNLADSTEHIAKQYVSREDGDTWVYDSIFQFSDELLLSPVESVTFGEATAFILPEPRDNAWSLNKSFALDLIVVAAQNASGYEISAGESATNTDQGLKAVA